MERKDFLAILRKYRRGTATPLERRLIEEWDSALGEVDQEFFSGDAELKQRQWWSVASHIRDSKRKKKNSKAMTLWYSTGIAASLLITLAIFFSVFDRQQAGTIASKRIVDRSASGLKRVVNTRDTSQPTVLPDGSEVTLAPESELQFSTSFDGSQREVYLEGEAFFEVSRDAARPFLVYANHVVTKVLGTSFTVKAFRGEKDITVAVRTGKVSVYTHRDSDTENVDDPKEIILTSNQQIVYNKDENKVSRMIVDSPQEMIPKEEIKRMRFEEARVSEIFEAMERVYGVDIVYDKQVFSSCTLTTAISDGDFYNRLDAICRAIDAVFAIEENKIVITGEGCRN